MGRRFHGSVAFLAKNQCGCPQDRPEYIGAVGRAVYDAMTAVDADAVWLMQAWMFLSEAPFWNR